MLLPKISHSDSLQLYMDVAEVVEINGHRRGLWGLTGTQKSPVRVKSYNLLKLPPSWFCMSNSPFYLGDRPERELVWLLWFLLFCSFSDIFSSQCWQRLQVGWWKITVFWFSSVAQSCLTLCDPMKRTTPGLPVHHQLPEFTQTHVHWVSYAFQPSHPLSSPSPPALNLSQRQGLFKWVSSSHQVAKVLVSASASVLPMNTQDWSPSGWTGWISLQSKGLSRVFSNIAVQKHLF